MQRRVHRQHARLEQPHPGVVTPVGEADEGEHLVRVGPPGRVAAQSRVDVGVPGQDDDPVRCTHDRRLGVQDRVAGVGVVATLRLGQLVEHLVVALARGDRHPCTLAARHTGCLLGMYLRGMHTAYMSIRHGLLALLEREPMYGYQLRSEFDTTTGSTWPLNVGQVYTTLARLERDGLVDPGGGGPGGPHALRHHRRGAPGARRAGSPPRSSPPTGPATSWRSSSPLR